jgi:hypothetical protein
MLWSWMRAMERRSPRRVLAVLFLFSVLMGIRLSFAPFGAALLWLLTVKIADWRAQGKRVWPRVLLFLLAAASFQALWIAGLVLSEGNLPGFLTLASGFIAGHFSEWGGGIASTPMPARMGPAPPPASRGCACRVCMRV